QDKVGPDALEEFAQLPCTHRRQVADTEDIDLPGHVVAGTPSCRVGRVFETNLAPGGSRRLDPPYSLCSEHAWNNGRQSAPRFFSTLVKYSCQVVRSFSSSLTIEPCRPAARSSAVTSPEPKLPASAMLLASTEMASAVERTPDGVLSLFLPSSVWPWRSSRKMVTTFSIASAAGTFAP